MEWQPGMIDGKKASRTDGEIVGWMIGWKGALRGFSGRPCTGKQVPGTVSGKEEKAAAALSKEIDSSDIL